MRSTFLIGSALVFAFFGVAARAEAAVSTTQIQTVVKLELKDAKGTIIGTGAGVQLDADGRILTTYAAIKPWEKDKKQPITICATKDLQTEPSCSWQATFVKSNASLDLALLQVSDVYANSRWMTVEERALRSSFAFSPIPKIPTTTTEAVGLGDELWIVAYPSAGGSTVTASKTSATGFKTRAVKNGTGPWMVKSDLLFGAGLTGGAAFDKNGKFVGIPAFATTTANQYGAIIGLPAVNAFLNEVLTADYQLGKIPMVFASPLIGIQAGKVPTTSCPDYSTADAKTKTCTCNQGFFAVGNSCITGTTYCSLRFPGTGSYDGFLKQCRCPTANGGSSECALPKPTTPKPATTTSTSTKPTVAASTSTVAILEKACKTVKNGSWDGKAKTCTCNKGFSFNPLRTACVAPPKPTCPTNASLDTKTNACACKSPFLMNASKNACILIGKPTTQAQLSSCAIVGKTATKLYYPKGHGIIKQMTHVGKVCFADEAAAKRAGYVKGK